MHILTVDSISARCDKKHCKRKAGALPERCPGIAFSLQVLEWPAQRSSNAEFERKNKQCQFLHGLYSD